MTLLAWLMSLPAAIITFVFALEVAAGLRRPAAVMRAPFTGTAAVIVPAHDEAGGVARTVASLIEAAGGSARVLVVADNCSDDTAALARAAGAEVIVRDDPARRGKGFALAYARDHLSSRPPQVVAVVDADCRIDAASLANLLARGADRPAQAVNLLLPDLRAGAMVQVSNFAFMVKNLIRQRGLRRLGGHVHLTGTGMAFAWTVFRSAQLATDDIVEDLGLGLDLADRGLGAVLVDDAMVWSAAATTTGTLKQRSRWEGGFIATSLRRGLPTVASGLARLDLGRTWSGLSLLVPPLALLLLIDALVAILLLAMAALGASPAPATLLILSMAGAVAMLLIVWRRHGRAYLTPAAAVRMPLYLLWKIPLYLGLARGKPRTWRRTDRD